MIKSVVTTKAAIVSMVAVVTAMAATQALMESIDAWNCTEHTDVT